MHILELINNLLDNVKLEATLTNQPQISRGKNDTTIRTDEQLSSGEKELISLAAEVLYFIYQIDNATQTPKNALLLLDEPDVHLHPDLQYKLIKLLISVTKDKPITTIISGLIAQLF